MTTDHGRQSTVKTKQCLLTDEEVGEKVDCGPWTVDFERS